MTAVEELKQWMQEAGVATIHCTKGFNPNVTEEQRAQEILASIKRIEEGDFTVISADDGVEEWVDASQPVETTMQVSFNPDYRDNNGDKV